jgi:hypothetical protein
MIRIKFVVCFISLFLSDFLFSQINSTFFADTCYWYVYDWNYTGNPMLSPPVYRHEYQKVEGDTIVDNKIYQKIYRKIFSSAQNINPTNFDFFGYYLQDSNKVYMGNRLDSMNLIYDFNLMPGDSFAFNSYSGSSTSPANYYIKVNLIDSINLNGTWRKRINFNSTASTSYINNITVRWIEGLGVQYYGPFHSVAAIQGLKLTGNINLVCFSENFSNAIGTCNFVGIKDEETEHFLKIYPNPSNDFIYLQSTQLTFTKNELPIIFDLNGKPIPATPQFINDTTIKLDVSHLHVGMYLIVLKTEKGVLRKKLIIE